MRYRKLKTAFLIALISASLASFSQSVSWDSTYRPNLYSGKLGQFKSFAHSTRDFVFLGNSITMGTDWNELLGITNAKNRGISGDITFGLLERLDEVIRGKPAKIFILIGTNDVARNIPDSVIVRNYQSIIRRIKAGSPRSKIYFHTILPVNNTFKPVLPHFDKDEHILWINARLKEMASAQHVVLVDLYSLLVDNEGKLNAQCTYDGLHLNEKGYFKWAELLKKGGYLK